MTTLLLIGLLLLASVASAQPVTQGTPTRDTEALTLAGCVRADVAAVAPGVGDLDRVRCIVDAFGAIWVHVRAIDGTVTVTGPLTDAQLRATPVPVSAASLPLPTGAATEATLGTLLLNSTITGRFPAGGTPADNESNAVTLSIIRSYLYCYDGTTWDRCPGNSADGLLVNLGANNDVTVTGSVAVTGTTFDGIVRDGAGDTTQANVSSGRLHVDGSGVTQPVSAASLPLPTGAATAANQDGIIRDGSGDTGQANVTSGRLNVTCDNCGGSGDGIIKDGSGDTTEANVSSGRLHVDGSGVTQPVSGTVTANQGGAPWSVAGPAADGAAVSGNPVRVAGKDGSGNTQDIATDTGGELQVDVLTLPSVTVGTFPDNEPFNAAQWGGSAVLAGAGNTGTGSPRVTIATDQAALTGFAIYTEDLGESAGGNLAMAGSVRRDTAASSAGTTGDNATINTDGSGLLWTRTIDPCSALAKTYLAVSISTATTTEITPSLAGASNHYYVCAINLVTAAANNVALVDDDSDGCGSVTSGLAGGITAATGWNFAANGGLTLGNGGSSVARTGGTNRVLCLMTSASTQLSGTLAVVAAP